MSNFPELHHVVDLPPAVLTHPLVCAGPIGSEGGGHGVVVAIVGRSDPVVLVLAVDDVLLPIVGRHDAGEAIGPAKHESSRHLGSI